MSAPQLDNSTHGQKIMLRQTALAQLRSQRPIIMETHGGLGDVWASVYTHVEEGIVFEKDPFRAAYLAHQRPGWSVYEAECEGAVFHGAGAHLAVNLLDVDPYGEPWPVINAFFTSRRPRPARMVAVVNDGLRLQIQSGASWRVKSLQDVVSRWGNDLWPRYLEVCQELLGQAAAEAGYQMKSFEGYYTGDKQKMTHYLAVLER